MKPESPVVRRGSARDLTDVSEIQTAAPEAAQWKVEDYLAYDFFVAECRNRVAGFIVARRLGEGESEILNLAVHPDFRRSGIGRRLWREVRLQHSGEIFLEVRQSNQAALMFYQSIGFQQVSVRTAYYDNPPEGAIVMKFHSC